MKRIISSLALVAAVCFAVASIPSQQPATAQQFVGVPSAETLAVDLSALELRVGMLESSADPESLVEAMGIDSPALASPQWTYPGGIRSHLASDSHGVDASGLTNDEAVDLHNRLHNAERRGVRTSQVSFDDCPDGSCPAGSFGSSSDNCPAGGCPTSSAGSAESGMASGPIRGLAGKIRERQPVRSFIRRFRCR